MKALKHADDLIMQSATEGERHKEKTCLGLHDATRDRASLQQRIRRLHLDRK
ncbi:hypothetical protein [Rhizobium mayense]|uniref:DUF465 domain-containing protein n=1 Tax=Rhizobium mayense TaxID=1312184 RepID=A0ABT7JS93_9HYPH|nr:hypothetical protein [Rhizobium mayense]MDL2399222.1 hypothetical protein [Rhizobium mayense]